MQDQRAEVDWRGGLPVSRRFDDPYYSLQDGAAETAHVFLAGNRLPDRFRDGFCIAELGFGTGLNLLVTLAAWRRTGAGGGLRFTSFEAFPMDLGDMATAHAAFPALAEEAAALRAALARGTRVEVMSGVTLDLVLGDARETLPCWDGIADAWFLDGFAPARNPELWEPALLAQVHAHTAPGGTLASYTAAGHVRRGLAEVGFAVERRAGFGAKRHMTVAERPA